MPTDSLGEDPSRFVAHLMLSVLYCHLQLAETADTHAGHAIDIIERLSRCRRTARVSRPMKLARIHMVAEEFSEAFDLPLVDTTLLAPVVDFRTLRPAMRAALSCGATVSLREIEIVHVRLGLHTTRLKIALAHMREIPSLELRANAITHIVDQCMLRVSETIAPLDMADHYFSLAREFARLRNHSFAALALEKAKSCIEFYANSTDIAAHRHKSDTIALGVMHLVTRVNASPS